MSLLTLILAALMLGPLRFENVGPEDASSLPFVIEVGAPAKSSERQFLVTRQRMAAIEAIVRRYRGTANGSYAVSSPQLGTVLLPADAMRMVVLELREMYIEEQAKPPRLLGILEMLLKTGKPGSAPEGPDSALPV